MNLSQKIAKFIVEKNLDIDSVVEVLRSYKLLSLLPSIKEAIQKMDSNTAVRDTVLIESPFEVSDEALKSIKRIVGNDLAPHEVTINKELLAGFKARFKEKLYDASAERIIRNLTH